MNLVDFEGVRAVVTAGTKGAGRATVERLLRGGASVITAARSAANAPAGASVVQVDLTTPLAAPPTPPPAPLSCKST
jgi:NAD(P)-dependent dehydrogenase (short-subunit alcohol dehydrogenase family)